MDFRCEFFLLEILCFFPPPISLKVTQGDPLSALWACQAGCVCIGECVLASACDDNSTTCNFTLQGTFQFAPQCSIVLSFMDNSTSFEGMLVTLETPIVESGVPSNAVSSILYLRSTYQSRPLLSFWKHFVVTRDQLSAERGQSYASSIYIWTDPQQYIDELISTNPPSTITTTLTSDMFFTSNLQTVLLGQAESVLFLVVGLIALYEVIHVVHAGSMLLCSGVRHMCATSSTASEEEEKLLTN